jgi:hydroxyacylglutathione hydrolase
MIDTHAGLRYSIYESTELPDNFKLQLLTTAQLHAQLRADALVLDTRLAEHFASLHIRGSIQISLMGNFASWAAMKIPPGRRLILIAEDVKHAQEAYNRLARVGLEEVIGYSLADEKQWRQAGLDLASISVERCEHIRTTLETDPAVQLVDVRSRAEWLKGHLPGAISMPLLDLDPARPNIDPSRPALVYCHEGYRATTAASILLRESAADVGILIDGVEGWSALGLPLEGPDSPPSSPHPSKLVV